MTFNQIAKTQALDQCKVTPIDHAIYVILCLGTGPISVLQIHPYDKKYYRYLYILWYI